MTDSRSFDCVILGAGISGLALSWKLARAGRRVAVLDAAPRVGGVIQSRKLDGGYLLEIGPNSFTSFPKDVMEIMEEAGLASRALARPMKEHDRFVWLHGRLCKVPMGGLEFVTSPVLTLGQKIRAARGVFLRLPPIQGDVTLGSYFRARLGDAVADNLLKPFMAGVYAADADRVSFEATFGKLHGPATRCERLVDVLKSLRPPGPRQPRPQRALVSFPEGLAEFPEGLARACTAAGVTIRTGGPISLASVGSWQVIHGAECFESPQVVIASSAPAAATLLQPIAPRAASILGEIEYAPLTVAHVGIREEDARERRGGFGFLTVANMGVRMLGMIWSDRIFPGRAPAGHRLMTCFYGGEKDPDAMKFDDHQLRDQLRKDLAITMGHNGRDFHLCEITRWDRAIPVFRVGHMRRVEALRAALPEGLDLIGNYLGGVSIPDRVARAGEIATRLLSQPRPTEVPA